LLALLTSRESAQCDHAAPFARALPRSARSPAMRYRLGEERRSAAGALAPPKS
jgi:hypothetical protein